MIIEEMDKKKKTKKLLVAGCWGNDNFVQNTLPPFILNFLSIFGEIKFWWAQRENSWGPPIFSPLPPPNQTPLPFIFSPIFHFFSHPSQNHPNQTYPYS